MATRALVATAACALLAAVAEAAVFTGSVGGSHGKLVFLGKFVFDDDSAQPHRAPHLLRRRPEAYAPRWSACARR